MTPSELETYVRQRYNAVGDNFYPQSEIFNLFWQAQMEVANETQCIKNIYTTTSVADQRSYDMPSLTISIARMEYDGKRIYPNDFLDDDAVTGNNPDDATSSTPINYQVFGSSFFLRPTPSTSSLTIKIYSYDMPDQPSTVTGLSIPSRYHLFLADFALFCMFAQDKNNNMALYHADRWAKNKALVQETERMRMVGDSFRTVKDHEELYIGPVGMWGY